MEQYFAVIGDPIAHSLSPVMHEAGYKALGIEARYLKFRVEANKLNEAVSGLRALGFSGCNVTIPHKERVLRYIDELTIEAKRAGAVNTIKFTPEKIIGHNTDGLGFVRSIQEKVANLKDCKAVILGAGGAARGIGMALANSGVNLLILNIAPEMTEQLVRDIRSAGGSAVGGEFKPGAWLKDADLLVQATSVGLHGENYPFELTGISPKTLVVDILFGPKPTPFLQNARSLGCDTLNGLGMLLYQGALAWEFWLGGKAPVEPMWTALLNEVEARQKS
ncbi:MAG: shikimate dehydrogenase [Desulfitobacteriaceae bacterium]|nr:shikimate dehydrogenase [Desulfitobacteriaceae bacterium]MDD4347142.1 shikimate dehydrogenase [Desulfitobacteriaceae bacterium]MDD4401588.1 shikimate dehydrogenase [Desulfitobacteriaceae bacterium]